MKKMNVLAAVVAVLAWASVAKAGEARVDFDSKIAFSGASDFLSVLRESHDFPEAAPIPAPAGDVEKYSEIKLALTVEACKGGEVKEEVYDGLKKLLIFGTYGEKAGFGKGGKFTIPARLADFKLPDLKRISDEQIACKPKCVSSHLEEVCVNQTVCTYVCVAAAAAAGAEFGAAPGAAAGIALGGKVCEDVCANVPKCSKVKVCDVWESACL